MNKLLATIFVTSFAFSGTLSACTNEEAAKNEVKNVETRKVEVRKVCIDKVTRDGKPVLNKDGTRAQDCKEMKVHQKLEGTKVPGK
jgi:hypothetical protein